jgi:phage replication-related protein YjqB (UPF0714/DUF867 family)
MKIVALVALSQILTSAPAFSAIIDTYKNFADLASHEKLGTTYQVEVEKHPKVDRAVIAIHGGNIEPGTGALAHLVAGQDFNLYVFTALEKDHPLRLHLTSTHFDDPKALEITSVSSHCVSLHGYEEPVSGMKVCVGGGDLNLKKKFLDSTPPKEVELIACSGKLAGAARTNIVNRCGSAGVQLEMTRSLRDRMLKDEAFMKSMANWIRGLM